MYFFLLKFNSRPKRWSWLKSRWNTKKKNSRIRCWEK